jgi:hypothetical protein
MIQDDCTSLNFPEGPSQVSSMNQACVLQDAEAGPEPRARGRSVRALTGSCSAPLAVVLTWLEPTSFVYMDFSYTYC